MIFIHIVSGCMLKVWIIFLISEMRRIYAVWTVSFLEHVPANVSEVVEKLNEAESNQMSGETMFVMENSGLVCALRCHVYR